jgi:UDP-glucuronate decarboxylase
MSALTLPPTLASQLQASRWRVIVTGASGWLGRAALELLAHGLGPDWHGRVEAFGSRPRRLTLRDGSEIEQRPLSELGALPPRPSLLLHFACLTREKVADMSPDDYVGTNREITRAVLDAATHAGIERAFVTSSGAVHAALEAPMSPDPTLLYGRLKLEDEAMFAAFANAVPQRRALVVRLFNLSGPYINKPYALSSFIEQATAGRIGVQACGPVIRSYTGVANLMAVGLGHLLCDEAEPFLCIETAGEHEVEMAALAEAVRAVVNPSATIARAPADGRPADRYVGDASAYRALMQQHGVTEDSLARQIADTADYLREFDLSGSRRRDAPCGDPAVTAEPLRGPAPRHPGSRRDFR